MRRFTIILAGLILCLGISQAKCKSLRVMSYNIRIGIGMDGNTDLTRVADVINRIAPDYVGLQEVDSVCERSGWGNQYAELARLTGMYPVFAPATERSKGLYGIAALSRKKPRSSQYVILPGTEEPRAFLSLEFSDYILCNTHLSLDQDSRQSSIRLINEMMSGKNKPIIITGDFNMEPDSEEFRAMSQAWRLLSDPTLETYPSDRPLLRLDYIFSDLKHEFKVDEDRVIDVQASDHLPIYIDVRF